jgi:hypothetical protein
MTKKLNTDDIQSELGSSAFFTPRTHSGEPRATQQREVDPHDGEDSGSDEMRDQEQGERTRSRGTVRTSDRPSARPPVRSVARRSIRRYAFEFFDDQIEDLRRLSLEDKFAGHKGSMSEMVREALDDYLARQRKRSR